MSQTGLLPTVDLVLCGQILPGGRVTSFSCRSSSSPAFVVCKMKRPGESYHVIHSRGDVHGDIFISPATKKLEKQDKLGPRDKSIHLEITESEAEPLKDGSTTSIANPIVDSFSLCELHFVI